jgi:hypothetical protein
VHGGGHGGSHSHLLRNLLKACIGRQKPMPDAETSVNWTMVGICAHQSALRCGEKDCASELLDRSCAMVD